MTHRFATLLLLVWLSLSLTIHTEEKIGEEYIVKILDGEMKKSLATAPIGVAFSLEFSRLSEGASSSGRQTTKQEREKGEEFYKKLVPVGRALESEALRGWRFAISVHTHARVGGNHDGSVSLAVAEEIKQFLTTSFAIAAERLIVRRAEASLPATDVSAESTTTPRWRVEIARLE